MTLESFHGPGGDRWRRRQQLAGDASTRRYSRIWDASGRSFILVEYPTDIREHMGRDLQVAGWLGQLGIRVPAVLARDLRVGWLVVEDLGPDDAEAVLRRTPADERLDLAESLLQPLEILAKRRVSSLRRWNPPLDRARLRWELAGFELWYVGHHRETTPSAELGRWLDVLAEDVAAHPKRIAHRDYHLNNLFFLGRRQTAVIDAQDVLVAPDTYDAVSLVEERAMPELLGEDDTERLRAAWADATGARGGWEERWARTRVQRALKVLGTFARLTAGGRPGYASWMGKLAHALTVRSARLDLPAELVDILVD